MNAQPFIVSFRARHPNMRAQALADAVGFAADVAWTAGEPRSTPSGRALVGMNRESYIACRLPASDSTDLEIALAPAMEALTARAPALERLDADGADLEFYVTINTEPRGVTIPPQLMQKLAALKVGLGLDGF